MKTQSATAHAKERAERANEVAEATTSPALRVCLSRSSRFLHAQTNFQWVRCCTVQYPNYVCPSASARASETNAGSPRTVPSVFKSSQEVHRNNMHVISAAMI